ncbi:MAG: hypothetical protein ABI847_15245, partial [Anaerolineales bacterium]
MNATKSERALSSFVSRPSSLLHRFTTRLFSAEVSRRAALAIAALDDARDAVVTGQRARERDRFAFDREEVLRDALEAWRTNPLARRIVSLTTQYVMGEGVRIESKHPATGRFLADWWRHRLNHMAVRAGEWCDELTRSGNLIVLVSTAADGMSYVRALPASQVQEIVTRPNDIEQAQTIIEKLQWGQTEPRAWPAYDETADRQNDDGSFATVALHYAVNRPVGATWGESDLAPLLRWLARYSNWLEDRARLNRWRQSFMYVVRGVFTSREDRLARQAELNANPPNPGSILVTDAQTEAWGVLHPQLDSFEAGEDGLALKKMLAAGSGNPMHFLAEPESSTRTTAEAAGGPTFRHYEQRQQFFLWLLADVARVCVARRNLARQGQGSERTDGPKGSQRPKRESSLDALDPYDPSGVSDRLDPASIKLTGSDISARDNAALAQAAAAMAAT